MLHTHTYTSGIQGTHVVHPRQAFTSLQPLQCCVDYPQHVRTQGVRIGFLLTVLRPQPQKLLLINMLVSIIYPIIAHHVCISMYIIQIHIIQYYKYYIYTYIYIYTYPYLTWDDKLACPEAMPIQVDAGFQQCQRVPHLRLAGGSRPPVCHKNLDLTNSLNWT